MEVSEIISLLLLIVNFGGFVLTIKQLNANKRINRAQLVRELYNKLYDDVEMMQIFYDIEYDNCPEDGNYKVDLHNSDYGRKCDKLFSYFEIICCLFYRKSLNKKDMEVFEYELFRIYSNEKVKEYFRFIKKWQNDLGYGYSYKNLEKYCEKYYNQMK